MVIGNVEIKNNVFLAPMAGITDMPFRILCKEQGAGLVYSEMVSAKGMYYNDTKSKKLTVISDIEKPVCVQIFGHDPKILAETAKELEKSEIDIIDINMGCPTPKIVKNEDGAALMKNPKLIAEIIEEVTKATSKPVTIKIRKGWDENNINAIEIAKIAQECGVSAITIHGRTAKQMYKGFADWDIIAKIKQSVSIPVIGNGDIYKPEQAKKMLDETGCDAVMIGRGAQGNPWIFSQTLEFLKSGKILPKPTNKDKTDMIIRHMNMVLELKGEHNGILEMRKHISWYLKGIKNAAIIRKDINRLSSKYDIVEVLNKFTAENELF